MSRHSCRIVSFAATILLTVSYVHAQVVVVPTFEVAHTTFGTRLAGSDVAVAPDGSLVFAWWEDLWDASQYPTIVDETAVMTRHLSAGGVPLGPPTRVSSDAKVVTPIRISRDVTDPEQSLGLVAVWTKWVEQRNTIPGNRVRNYDARPVGRYLDYAGQPIGDELPVASGAMGELVATGPLRSQTALLWYDGFSAEHGLQIDLWDSPTLFHAGQWGLENWWHDVGPFPVLDTANFTIYADLEPMPDGGFLIIWTDWALCVHGAQQVTWGRLFDSQGVPRGPAFPLGLDIATKAAVNPIGGFAVVGFTASNCLPTDTLVFRRFSNDGSPLGDPVPVYQGDHTVIYRLSPQFDADGNLYIAWDESGTHHWGDDRRFRPKARAFDANGTALGPPVEVGDQEGLGVTTALLPNRQIINVWTGTSGTQLYASIVSVCPPGGACPTPVPVVCGDGIVGPGEECDDGNLVDGDGCDSNCTITRCGNGIVTAGEQCDDGNQVNGDGCDNNCTFTGCGNGIVDPGEQCDDGNDVDGDGCQADCTLTPRHDSVLVSIDPIKITIPASQDVFTKIVPIQVRNADIVPEPERPGHVIQLNVAEGDCPAGTIVGLPDFEQGTPGDQDAILVTGGAPKTAQVIVQVSRAAFPNLDNKVPQRCTLRFTAQTVVAGNVDPTPENNTQAVELNVVAAGNGNGAGGSTLTQSSVVPPAFFIVSAKPVKVTLRARQGVLQKKADVTVTVGGSISRSAPVQTVTVTTSDGDCPAGTVGVSDFNTRLAGAQAVVTLGAGKTARGKLPLTIDAAAFTSPNAKSPARCTALITSTTDGTAGPTNHVTKLLIEVTDHNDF